jgi:hypothetical protein
MKLSIENVKPGIQINKILKENIGCKIFQQNAVHYLV